MLKDRRNSAQFGSIFSQADHDGQYSDHDRSSSLAAIYILYATFEINEKEMITPYDYDCCQ